MRKMNKVIAFSLSAILTLSMGLGRVNVALACTLGNQKKQELHSNNSTIHNKNDINLKNEKKSTKSSFFLI